MPYQQARQAHSLFLRACIFLHLHHFPHGSRQDGIQGDCEVSLHNLIQIPFDVELEGWCEDSLKWRPRGDLNPEVQYVLYRTEFLSLAAKLSIYVIPEAVFSRLSPALALA